MVPKGLVDRAQCRQIEDGEFVLELGCFYRVQEGLHVFVAEQQVHHSVGSFAADGLVGAGRVEEERLQEIGWICDGSMDWLCGFLLTGNGNEIVAEFHLSVLGDSCFRGGRGIRGRRLLSLSK